LPDAWRGAAAARAATDGRHAAGGRANAHALCLVEVDPQYSDVLRKAHPRIPRLKALHEKEPRGRMVLGGVDKRPWLKP
jgi:hypothetical protein